MKVELLRAWPRRFERAEVDLPEGSRVADALAASGWADDSDVVAHAVFGVRVDRDALLRDGDRIELLRPLQADPMQARRRRAAGRRKPPGIKRSDDSGGEGGR